MFWFKHQSLHLALGASSFMLASGCSTQKTTKVPADFKPGVAWNIILHNPIDFNSADSLVPTEAKVWDIDLGHARDYPEIMTLMKDAGKLVICYFNGGAVQDWDDDKGEFSEAVIGKSLSYPFDDEEWYVDIRSEEVVSIMKARMDLAVQVGCDAVDPDNVDAWAWGEQDDEDPTGFKLQPEDYAKYLRSLADYAHTLTTQSGNSLLVGQKNAPDITLGVVETLDFAVLESCRRDSFCSEYQPYINLNKPVFQIEYPPSVEETGSLSTADEETFCDDDGGSDNMFSKILKFSTAQVDGWGQYCGGESWETPTYDG